MMHRDLFRVAVIVTAAGLTGCATAKEKNANLPVTPDKVQVAIKQLVGDGKVEKIKPETEDGKTVYEVEYEVKDVDHSATFDADGKVLEEETELKSKDLPASVVAAIKAKYATGKIEDASLVKSGGTEFYEVDVEVGSADHELKIDKDGKILADEVKDEKEEKDEKK